MIYDIINQPKHIDVEFDVVGTLYKVYLFPETGTFEVACWNDGDESVYDGFSTLFRLPTMTSITEIIK